MRKQVEEICASVEKIEHSLKKIRSSKSMKSNTSSVNLAEDSSNQALTDTEKIYLQLYLDVHCLLLHLRSLVKQNTSPGDQHSIDEIANCVALSAQVEFASAFKLRKQ